MRADDHAPEDWHVEELTDEDLAALDQAPSCQDGDPEQEGPGLGDDNAFLGLDQDEGEGGS